MEMNIPYAVSLLASEGQVPTSEFISNSRTSG